MSEEREAEILQALRAGVHKAVAEMVDEGVDSEEAAEVVWDELQHMDLS